MVGSGGRLSAAAPARERSLPPTSSGVRDAQGPHEARKAPAKVTTIQDTPYFTPAQCERLQARARGHHTSAAKWDQMRMAACSFIAAVGAKLGWRGEWRLWRLDRTRNSARDGHRCRRHTAGAGSSRRAGTTAATVYLLPFSAALALDPTVDHQGGPVLAEYVMSTDASSEAGCRPGLAHCVRQDGTTRLADLFVEPRTWLSAWSTSMEAIQDVALHLLHLYGMHAPSLTMDQRSDRAVPLHVTYPPPMSLLAWAACSPTETLGARVTQAQIWIRQQPMAPGTREQHVRVARNDDALPSTMYSAHPDDGGRSVATRYILLS
ncbi:unnamed protein product [Malassezia sympodialis ATCC 42132]|uniref:uncharacterized protein n=1 Tax=Malassezia sympodialis (strain ATCC 42132) TaxID=1230383 RepID=UPI0002C1D7F3|nr:uncharacterized protein MSY001_3001 [Malassezia sympodialis ATCC 42132]CCV00296.1 unnamed protein product [Malassezia sympodialis ATCC 42132]|eukprot:XP_018741501.1 uncharacterized protein MSY001_3001 [Malassezia sympodialis ATCC 42132]